MQQRPRALGWAAFAGLLLTGHVGVAQTSEDARVEVRTIRIPKEVIEIEGEPTVHAVFLGDESAGGGYLGVELLPLTEELRRHFGVPEDRGVMISRVAGDSPAATAGLQAADIVTAVDGEAVDSVSSLSRLIRHKEPGEEISLEVFRDGRAQAFTLGVGERRHGFRWHAENFTAPRPEVLERLHEYLDGDAWRQRMERFEKLDWKEIEERMQEVEERLLELERQLEKAEP